MCDSRGNSGEAPAQKKAKGKKAPAPDTGSVHETDLQHRQRHSCQPCSADCCRCNFIIHKAELAREFPWLGPRPSFLGGRWRLGCDVCRWKACLQGTSKDKHAQPGRRGSATRASSYARHEAVYTMPYFKMLGFIKQHASYDGHRAAEIAAKRVSLRPPPRDYPRIPSSLRNVGRWRRTRMSARQSAMP